MKSDAVIERIKARVAAIDPTTQTVKGVFQLNIKSASGVVTWVVDLNALKVTQDVIQSPDCIIGISDEDFVLIGSKQLTADAAAAAGKLEIFGDEALANALISKLAAQ